MLRRLVVIALLVVLVPVGLAAVALVALQTAPGRALVETAVARLTRDSGTAVTLQGLHGGLPLSPRLDRIELADRAGVWLRVEGARLELDAGSLLRLQPRARLLAAERIELLRAPEGDPQPAPSEPVDLGVLLRLPPLALDRLVLPEIVIGEAVIGEELRFAADGSVTVGGARGAARATLDLRRLAETTTRATLDLAVEPSRDTAELRLDVQDDAGLLGAILDRPVGVTSARLAGSGPLDRWSGTLEARAEGLVALDLALDASWRAPLRLALRGSVEPAPGLVPEPAATLVGPRVTLAAVAGLAADGAWRLDGIAVETAQLRATGALSGSPEAVAQGAVHVTAPRLEIPEVLIEALAADLTIAPAPAGGWSLGVDASSRPQRVAGRELTALGATRLVTTAVLGPDPALEIPSLRLSTALGTLEGSGRAGPGLASLDARGVATVPQLADLAPLAGIDGTLPRAAARITLAAERGGADRPIRANARVALDGLTGLPEPAAALVGSAPTLDLAASLHADRRIDAIRASLGLQHGTALVTGTIDLAAATSDLALSAGLPDLAPLGGALGTGLGGAAELTAAVTGPLDRPVITARLDARDLVAAGQRLERLEARVDEVALAPEPGARIAVRAARGDAPLELGTVLRLDGSRLEARDLVLTGPALRLAGEASLQTTTGLASGRLAGTIGDLARLRPWHEQPLRGAAEIELAAQDDDAAQSLRLRATGRDLAHGETRVGRLELAASARDVLRAPDVDATLDLAGAQAGTARLDTGRLTVQGPALAPRYRIELAGDADGPVRLAARGDLALRDAGARVTLTELTARVRDTDIAQDGRAVVEAVAAGWSVAGLALRSGPARLAADLAVSRASARGAVRLRGLPAAMLAAAGAPPLQGTLTGDVELSGTGAEPRLRVSLRADDLTYVGEAGEGVPPADLTVEGTLAGGRLEAQATLAGLGDKPVTASATLPVALTLTPPAASLSQTQPLRARLVVDGEVSRLVPRHLLDERRLTGALRGELRLAGTLAAPRAAGTLRLDGGTYDDAVTGTTLREITLEVTGREREVVVQKLTATDGAGGRLDADARVLIDDRLELPWQGQVRLDRLRALRTDLIDATVSGRIDATGSYNRADLRGRIEVERAEITVPSRLGGSVPVIEVREPGEPAAGPPPSAPARLTTSLAIDVTAPGQVFVRGRGIESEWQAELDVRGAIDAPRLVGTVTLRRGQFDFLGRRLQLTRGTITFAGADPPDPALDIRGESRAAEVTAIVEIGGSASRPVITLSSEPALPQDEVLARLLFGRDTSRISAAQGLQIASALREIAGISDGPGLTERLRSGIGLDTLDFSTEEGETGLRAGRYLSDDVYVQVERGVAPGSGRATVEIELTPNLRVQSEVTDRATSGVGLEWRMDY